MSYMPKSKSDVHLTPDLVYDIIEEKWGVSRDELHDPCPEDTPHNAPCFFNGLYGKFKRYSMINPPYAKKPRDKNSMLHNFVVKAIQQANENDCTSFMLLPSKTDQRWFHYIVEIGYDIHWFEGRIKFKNNKYSATQPHFLVKISP